MRQKLLPMRVGTPRKCAADQLALHVILFCSKRAAHRLKAQEYEVCIDDIGLAIVPYIGQAPSFERGPNLRAIHPELAGEAQQLCNLVQRRHSSALVQREQIHQIAVAHVVATDVIVVTELPIILTDIPVARRSDAVYETAIVQDRQVEPGAVPRDELRRVLFDSVEEALDNLAFARSATDRPYFESFAIAQRTGDCDDTMQMQRQKLVACSLAPQLKCHRRHSAIGHVQPKLMKLTQPGDVRDRFDIEDEDRRQLLANPGAARVLVVPARLRFVDPALGEGRTDVVFPLGASIGSSDLAVERSTILVFGGH
jgi:hypothetical protein